MNNMKSQIEVKSNKLYLVVDIVRPGACLFAVKLEYYHFPPRTEKNKNFEITLIKWPDDSELVWSLMSVPIEYRNVVEKIASEVGLRLADGIPMIFSNNSQESFPVQGNNVFTLENVKNHSIYNASMKEIHRLKNQEEYECNQIIDADKRQIYKEMTEQGYSPEQIDRFMRQWELGDETYDEIPKSK